MTVLNYCAGSNGSCNHGNGDSTLFQFIYHNGKTDKNMSDFIISFNLFGEYDNCEVWDAAEEKEKRI